MKVLLANNISNVLLNKNKVGDNFATKQNANYSSDINYDYNMPKGNAFGLALSPSFGSKLETFKVHKPIIKEGLNALDKEKVALIIHGGSFPATHDTDTGYGSPNSTGARQLIDFISGVFTDIQFGPGGKTKLSDSSPYTSTLFSANPSK